MIKLINEDNRFLYFALFRFFELGMLVAEDSFDLLSNINYFNQVKKEWIEMSNIEKDEFYELIADLV